MKNNEEIKIEEPQEAFSVLCSSCRKHIYNTTASRRVMETRQKMFKEFCSKECRVNYWKRKNEN